MDGLPPKDITPVVSPAFELGNAIELSRFTRNVDPKADVLILEPPRRLIMPPIGTAEPVSASRVKTVPEPADTVCQNATLSTIEVRIKIEFVKGLIQIVPNVALSSMVGFLGETIGGEETFIVG